MGLAKRALHEGRALRLRGSRRVQRRVHGGHRHAAYEASSDLAAERGTYSSYKGSKWDRGLLPQDTVDLLEQERGVPIQVPRGSRLDWAPLPRKIAAHGMRNSNVLASRRPRRSRTSPTRRPCIEPTYKNLYVKSNLSGEFVVLNPYLVRDLKGRGPCGTRR